MRVGGDAPVRPRVVLVGPPGAGKTTVGRLLAHRWAVELCDTDAMISTSVGKAISEIFVDDGEAAFRLLEQSAVVRALTSDCGVVSLGGGAVTAAPTRERLADQTVAFLDVGLAAAASRVGFSGARPLLLGNVRSQLKGLLDARRPLYDEVATFTVATDGVPPEAVADEIERHLDD